MMMSSLEDGVHNRPICVCRIAANLLFVVALLLSFRIAYGQGEIGPTLAVTPFKLTGLSSATPGYYLWDSPLGMSGTGWGHGETITIHLYGPLNTPGVIPNDRILGHATANSSGVLVLFEEFGFKTAGMYVPYNEVQGLNSFNNKSIPRPGYYQIIGRGIPGESATVSINIAPNTIGQPTANPYVFSGWPRQRGAREGWLGSNSPERADPEWPSVWTDKPVQMYATLAPTNLLAAVDDPPVNQPSFIAHSDLPNSHYAHDVNMELAPDPEYLWLLGSANYFSETFPGKANFGRMECEWETLNNKSPFFGSYGKGNIGMPLWVMPTVGDRVYMVGRWVMDNGHPDGGDRTEIHPPRLLATMRKLSTVTPLVQTGQMTRASQVDVYVSGHGGAANMFPTGLGDVLDNGGQGGGNTLDNLTPAQFAIYFAFGPTDNSIATYLADVLRFIGQGIDPNLIKAQAGPSGIGLGAGAEFRSINDMDYDFDVPLPAPPAGATTPAVSVIVQPGHTTSVHEVITYTKLVNGLPTVAHFHLPYNGVDNLEFAKTFKFFWDVYNPPAEHFTVQINSLWTSRGGSDNSYLGPGPLYLWTDVNGQWVSLSDANPGGLIQPQTALVDGINQANFINAPEYNIHALNFDVYLDKTDSLRVFTSGYAQRDFDKRFGVDVGQSVYTAGLHLIDDKFLGTGDNVNLGGAIGITPLNVFTDLSQINSSYFVSTGRSQLNETELVKTVKGFPCPDPVFSVSYSVQFVPRAPGLVLSGLPMKFGAVTLGAERFLPVTISNTGELPLQVQGIAITGGGFKLAQFAPTSFTVNPGKTSSFNVYFSPTAVNHGTGRISFQTNDPLHLSVVSTLTGTVNYPILSPSANTSRTPSLVVGTQTTWLVTIANQGTSTLHVKPSIVGDGFSVVLPASYYNSSTHTLVKDIVVAPGQTNTDLVVAFTCPSVGTKFVGTLSLSSDDPLHPVQTLVFGAEGVPVGIRVLVVNSSNTPYQSVDQITVNGGPNHTKINLKNAPLKVIVPPKSWKTIQYQLMAALPSSSTSFPPKVYPYTLDVRMGNKHQTMSFTLGVKEFKQVVITLDP